MTNKAFVFTMDAVLALIPVFVIMAGVSSLSYDDDAFLTIPITKQAQDSVEMLVQGETPLAFEWVNTSNAINITNAYNFSITYSYMLNYSSSLNTNWVYVTGRSNSGTTQAVVIAARNAADDVYAAERIYYYDGTMHRFRIFMWFE